MTSCNMMTSSASPLRSSASTVYFSSKIYAKTIKY